MTYTIVVNDTDAEQTPDEPWTATVYDGTMPSPAEVVTVGRGTDPRTAVSDALLDLHIHYLEGEE